MMKRKNNKRGFTIIELTIVVAVIAILSAVLIPTFSSIIKKSRQSADQQAVTTINKVLAGEVADKPEDITEVIKLMAENGYDVEDYKPLVKDNFFYWVASENVIVIADANNNVLYPAQYADLTYVENTWWSLTGAIEVDDSWTVTEGKATVASAGQLVSLMEKVTDQKGKGKNVTTIELSSDLDMKGSSQNFNFGKFDEIQDIVFDGKGKTITNFRVDENSQTFRGNTTNYGYGFFGYVPKDVTITIKNVTFKNVIVASSSNVSTGSLGVIAGNVKGTLNIENVIIEDCQVIGEKKVAAAVGYVGGDSASEVCVLNINGLTVKDTTVTAAREGAQVVGYMMYASNFGTITNVNAVNVTVSADASLAVEDTITYNEDKTVATENGTAIKAGIFQNHYIYHADLTGHNW